MVTKSGFHAEHRQNRSLTFIREKPGIRSVYVLVWRDGCWVVTPIVLHPIKGIRVLKPVSPDEVLQALKQSVTHTLDLSLQLADCPTTFEYVGVFRDGAERLDDWIFTMFPEEDGDPISLSMHFDRYDAFELDDDNRTIVATKGTSKLVLAVDNADAEDRDDFDGLE